MNKMIYALAINQIPRLSSRQKLALLQTHGDKEHLLKLNKGYLTAAFHWKQGPLDMSSLLMEAERQWNFCLKDHIHVELMESDHYPEILTHIYDPPFLLFTRGRRLEQDFSGAAIVGTRRPTGNAVAQAFQVGLDLALRECPVVSGLALGVDGAAHRGALAGWGWTLGVLACGVDLVYPAEHRRLAWEMLETGGSLISEYAPGTKPRRYFYPQRNRIISGLSMVSVVIQAPQRSGALITADFALQEGRDLLIGSSGMNSQGSKNLAEQGAPVIQRGRELLTLLGVDTELRPGSKMKKMQNHKEMHKRIEQELDGSVISFGGEQYYAL